jgi:hypothetical protein
VILQRRLARRSENADREDASLVPDVFFKGSCLVAMLDNLFRYKLYQEKVCAGSGGKTIAEPYLCKNRTTEKLW